MCTRVRTRLSCEEKNREAESSDLQVLEMTVHVITARVQGRLATLAPNALLVGWCLSRGSFKQLNSLVMLTDTT